MQMVIDDGLMRDSEMRLQRSYGSGKPRHGDDVVVFAAMSPTKLPTIFESTSYGRSGRLEVPGMVSSKGVPIRNPVTGAEHRVRIDFPQS